MCHQTCPLPVTGGAGVVEERIEVPGAETAVPAVLARPEGQAAPGVLIIHDIWGANDFYQDVARRLAGEGFAALLPDLFVRQEPLVEPTREAARARSRQLDQATVLADIAGALTWLRAHEATTDTFGTVGFCMGGTLVMLAAAREPVPDASVAFYGFPVRERTALQPRNPMDELEVTDLRSPLLGLWGDQDVGVGMHNVAAYEEALQAHGKPYEFVVYPGAGHAFLTFDPASPTYEVSQAAWEKTIAFLRAKLAG